MELTDIRSKTIGDLTDELGRVLTNREYSTIEALAERTRQSLVGVDERLTRAALLTAFINTLASDQGDRALMDLAKA